MRQPVIIRPMQPHEHGEVARLFHEVWHETQSQWQDALRAKFRDLGFFRQRIDDHAERTLLAIYGTNVLGFGCWTGGRLDSLFVARDARSSGTGGAVLQALEAAMRASGATQFELDCLLGNDAGRRFYERHGWRVTEERSWEDETPEGPAWARSWVMVKP